MATTPDFCRITCSPGRTSPEFSGDDRDGEWWSPTPPDGPLTTGRGERGDLHLHLHPKSCSDHHLNLTPNPIDLDIGARLSPSFVTPEAQQLGIDNKLTDSPSSSPSPSTSALVKCARRRRGRMRRGSESKEPALACPFYKFDPRSNHDCRGFTLRRVKDIKQHIQRKHTEFYCDRCLDGFDDADEHMATHQQDPHFAYQPPPTGSRPPSRRVTTSEQQENLKSYLGRGKPIEDQWCDVWDILFPGQHRPRTIYLDSVKNSPEGRMKMLRRVWERHRHEILTLAYPLSPLSVRPPGWAEKPDLWRGLPLWQQPGPSSSPPLGTTTSVATLDSCPQWGAFDHAMDRFLDLVKEEMADDDVADTCGPQPGDAVVEATGSLPGTQQQWYPSPYNYRLDEPDFNAWPQPAGLGIGVFGHRHDGSGTLPLVSGMTAYSFPCI